MNAASFFMIFVGGSGLLMCYFFGDKWNRFFSAKKQDEARIHSKELTSAVKMMHDHDDAFQMFDD